MGPGPLRLKVAFLRGVNLGAGRRLPMSRLREVARSIGWGSVATHLQSGNLIFAADGEPSALAAQLSAALNEQVGLPVDVVIRDGARLSALIQAHPFRDGDPAQVVIACCDRLLGESALARLSGLRAGDEQVQLAPSGSDLYAVFPDGQARSRLAAGLVGALTPATGTVRNLRTMTAVGDLLRAEPRG